MTTPASSDVWRLLGHSDRTQLLYQLQEIFEARVYLQHGIQVRPGDVVLDVGANVGVSAVFFASECGAVVHSFEPVTPIYEMLVENVKPYPNCSAYNIGLASRNRTAPITYYPNADAMSGLQADPEIDREFTRACMRNLGMSEAQAAANLEGRYDEFIVLTCELRTLSSVLVEHEIAHAHLLKIDVERSELEVLDGIDDADWSRIDQVVAEVHDEDARLAAVTNRLARHGFEIETEQEPAMRGTGLYLLYAKR